MLNDLMACYREVAPDCITQDAAWKRTVAHPAKRFYISATQAYQRINMYIKGRTEAIEYLKPSQAKMYYDLIDVIKRLKQSPEYEKKSLRQLCMVAVTQPAPRFYISAEWFRKIFCDLVKFKVFDEEGRNTRYRLKAQTPEHRARVRNALIKYRHKYIK